MIHTSLLVLLPLLKRSLRHLEIPTMIRWPKIFTSTLQNFLINALHIVDDQGQRESCLDYISGCHRSKTRHLSYNTEKWVGIEVSKT
jgi:hypothetical protein